MDVSVTIDGIQTVASALGFCMLESPAKQVGYLLADQVKYYRRTNLIKMLKKAEVFCKKEGVNPKLVPKSFSSALFEAAQHQDDEDLQNRWASLLANAVNGHQVHPSYISILRDLTSVEVKVLEYLYKRYSSTQEKKIYKSECENLIINELKSINKDVDPSSINLILGNLFRLNLVRLVVSAMSSDHQPKCDLSDFAIDFIRACSSR